MLHGTPWLKLITRWPAASVSDTSAAICLIKSGSADAIRRASRFMPGPGLGGHTGRLGTTAAKRIRLFPAQYPAAKAPIVTATAVAAAVAQSFSKNAAEKGESASSIADILIPMYVGVTGVAGGCGGCSSVG